MDKSYPIPVSVVMPSYNHEKYVGKAIESVLGQDYSDFEFLICDDGSSDESKDVIKGFTDSRIKANYASVNAGASINTKRVFANATGKYIALINSDDLWLPGKLKKQVEFLESNPEYVACFTWANVINENDDIVLADINLFIHPNRTQAEWLEYFYSNGNCICHPSMVIRSAVLEELGFYNGAMRQLPDFEMWIRLVKRYPIYIIQEVLTSHRRFIRSGENTSTPSVFNSMRDVVESSFILSTYFDGITDELFIQAFGKYFRNPFSSSKQELACEKFFILLDKRYYIGVISILSAVNYFLKTYNDEGMSETYKDKFRFTLQDFYNLTGQIDLVGLLPRDISLVEQGSDFNPERYIQHNKMKALSIIFFRRDSKIYNLCKRLYKHVQKI